MGTNPQQRRTSMAEALFTRTQRRVLALLFGSPERSFFATEIFDRTGTGRGAVQRELSRLAESGLVRVRTIGNQKHYQANPQAPIFEELRSIVRKTSGLADPLRQALEPLAPDLDLVLIYGSVAKAEETADSDVDLLVVADDLRLEELYERLQPVEHLLGRRVNPTVYTRAELARRLDERNSFLRKVLEGPTIHLLGREDVARASR